MSSKRRRYTFNNLFYEATRRCNLACPMCMASSNDEEVVKESVKRELSADEIEGLAGLDYAKAAYRVMSPYLASDACLAEGENAAKKRLLLLWQSPDGHPAATHEYAEAIGLQSVFLFLYRTLLQACVARGRAQCRREWEYGRADQG